MEAGRFDALTRSLTAAGTRRRALIVALGGALSTIGVLPLDNAVAGGNCKPKCKECTKCKKGKKGKKGKCKPAANGTPCSQGKCQGGLCAAPPPTRSVPVCRGVQESCAVNACCAGLLCDENFCDPSPVCCADLGGSCGGDECDCCGAATLCDGSTCICSHELCSGECLAGGECCVSAECGGEVECIDGSCVCPSGLECGTECCDLGADEVCKLQTGVVVGCQGGGCPVTDLCTDPNRYICGDAGDGCACATSIDDQTICSDFRHGSSCEVDCASDTECAAIAPGWVCIENTGGLCADACPGGQNFCVAPGCPSTAPLGAEGRSRFGSPLIQGATAVAAGTDTRSVGGTAKHVSRKRRTK
jgi:hypothetical protein